MQPVVVEVFGDFACFTRPECKVERLTYPVMTPSAARGILSAIYSKPVEFYWQITKIEVLKPIQYISFMRSEVKAKSGGKAILVDKERTQRQSTMLKDVRYRISAEMIKRGNVTEAQIYSQAKRRIKSGKCFYQPSLGLRECVCFFEEPSDIEPIRESMDFGTMLYDVFNFPDDFVASRKEKPYVTLFHAEMKNGVIEVPRFESDKVFKPL